MIRAGVWFVLMMVAWPVWAQGSIVEEIRDILRNHALDPPSEELLASLNQTDMAGLLVQIDPYARLFSPGEAGRVRQHSWIGIGAGLAQRDGQVVLHVYRGGGADRAGIADRSRLLAIDGQPVAGLDLDSIAARLRGEPGSQVRLQVGAPQGDGKIYVVRREVFTPLDVELVPPGTQQVVRIRDFSAGMTRPAMRATLEFLKHTAEQAALPLIIDLRDAPGGDLYEAFDLAGIFVTAGMPLGTIRGREGHIMEIRAPAGPKYSMPIILLIGPETASSAEIFAGILHRHARARLVGQTTYGKCSSQTDAVLSDGSVLRYTNKEVLFFDGDTCSGVGLVPDVQVGDDEFDLLPRLVERARAVFP